MGNRKEEGLPEGVADRLPKEIRDALRHPYRRQILRELGDDQRLSAPDLTGAGRIPCSVSSVSYHARCLEACGLVEQVGTQKAEGSLKYLFSSLVADNDDVQQVLRATQQLDRERLEPTTG